ncbi:MAG: NAD-dependent epimerase/dehydratase family protein [Magnetospirillum sp. WYHS-4]
MTILVTGAAGFIGFHLVRTLLARGDRVVGVDNLNDYYDVGLKEARLARLRDHPGFAFERLDIADRVAMESLADRHPDVTDVVSLAAQPGVRYSLVNPYAYVHTNVDGHLCVLELCRRLPQPRHLVYASSSSVYGLSPDMPLAVEQRTDSPISLYAATKKSAELMSRTYAHLYRLPQTGLRYFTVYGPWGRPDMAPMIFTRKILAGEPIQIFNQGDMRRDFTYVDDIVAGTIACLDSPPADRGETPPHRIYNIGNNTPVALLEFIAALEAALGRTAVRELLPMQPGDVKETFADIEPMRRDFGYRPRTPLSEGIGHFVAWYKDYFGV